MKRLAAPLILSLVVAACGSGTSGTSQQTATSVLAETTTTTKVVGGGASSTTTPPATTGAAGYAIHLANSLASGYSSIDLAANSCGSVEGPWSGAFLLLMDTESMSISGGGSLSFTLKPGETITGTAPFDGSGSVESASCTIVEVSDPLVYEMTLDPSGTSVDVILGSKGGGTITFQCDNDPPITIPFAVAWGPEPLTVPIKPLSTCK